jgi:hypothetical protein
MLHLWRAGQPAKVVDVCGDLIAFKKTLGSTKTARVDHHRFFHTMYV